MEENGMATGMANYTIHYPEWFTERVEMEMTDKGYFAGPFVELEDGSRYELYFYDPVRLAQDLERMLPHGYPCLAKGNMVVVPEVTLATIQTAIDHLVRQGYFRHLKPAAPVTAVIGPNGS
jgi:hypothetical protein